MRAVLDTNILISALLVKGGPPDDAYRAWRRGQFTFLTCQMQLEELRLTLRKPALAARLINDLKLEAVMVDPLPSVERSPDPAYDFLLAAAEAGCADFLVTGDKSGLLALGKHASARIVTAREFTQRFT